MISKSFAQQYSKKVTMLSQQTGKQMKESAIAQLRKRSKDSIARPRAEKNMLSNNPQMQKI